MLRLEAAGAESLWDELTVEGNVRRIFDKLLLTETPDDNRPVLAVLAFLRGEQRDPRHRRG